MTRRVSSAALAEINQATRIEVQTTAPDGHSMYEIRRNTDKRSGPGTTHAVVIYSDDTPRGDVLAEFKSLDLASAYLMGALGMHYVPENDSH